MGTRGGAACLALKLEKVRYGSLRPSALAAEAAVNGGVHTCN